MLNQCPLITLHSVDPWNGSAEDRAGSKEIAQARLEKFGDRSKIFVGYSVDAAATIADETVGFVYIDGDHSEEAVRKDIAAWWPKLQPGGMLAGHDIQLGGVLNAVTDFVGKHEGMSYLTTGTETSYDVIYGEEACSPSWYIQK